MADPSTDHIHRELELERLRDALRTSAESVAVTLLGQPASRDGDALRWGRRGSLRVTVRGRWRGLFRDFEDGSHGDLLDLAARQLGADFAGASAWARGFLGLPQVERPRSADPTRAAALQAERERRQEQRQAARERDALAARRWRDQRIAEAQRLWAAAVPIAGTLAARYLTETRAIPRPAGGWPDAIRYHPGKRAMVVAATDAAGAVRAIQWVNLTADARKRRAGHRQLEKETRGARTGAAVRLPGLATGPLLLAEGAETGMSAWAATGHEVWVALGAISGMEPPASRALVILADDDAPGSPAAKARAVLVARWRAEGRTVAVATPWATPRGDKTDLNDVLAEAGTGAVAARIHAALDTVAAREVLPLPVARQRLAAVVGAFAAEAMRFNPDAEGGSPPPVHVVRAGVGLGKSAAARLHGAVPILQALRAQGDARPVVMAVPTHTLGEEAAAAFNGLPEARRLGLRAAIWRGREAERPRRPGEALGAMCQDLATVRAVQAVRGDVERGVCRNEKAGTACPLFATCAYQQQKRQAADLWIVAHEAMFSPPPAAIGRPAALLVDEAPWRKGLDPAADLTLDALDPAVDLPGRLPGDSDVQRLRHVHRITRAALDRMPDGPLDRAALLAAGLDASTGASGRALSWLRVVRPEIVPGMPADNRRAALAAVQANRVATRVAALFRALEALLAEDGPVASGWAALATRDGEDGPVRVLHLRGRRDVARGWRVPTLLTDALADPALLQPYWPQLRLVADLQAETPHLRILQLMDRDWPQTALVPDPRQGEAENRRRRRHAADLRAVVMREARTAGGTTLAVAQQAVEALWLGAGPMPGVATAHFNAIAGRDRWREAPLAVVAGRTLPPASAVEDLAEALTGRAVAARVPRFEKVAAEIHLAGAGGGAALTTAYRHPDPVAEAIRWQVCEGELVQAIGRVRGVNRTAANPATVLVLCSLPLPVAVEPVSWAELEPTATDCMLAAAGVALENAADAARAFPDLWPSAEAARKARQRA
ncbi:DUF7146 domain-containing protein, partial [Roseomonas mucosa]